MSVYQPAKTFQKVKIVAVPESQQIVADAVRSNHPMPDRHFGLPPVVHGALFGLIMAYLGVMAIAFGAREMIIPFVIFALFVSMFFAVPACWSWMKPDAEEPAPKWAAFLRDGVDVETGHLSANAALVQIFCLPVLILGWGISVAIIAA